MSLESENPLADYYVVRKELAAYEDGSLAHKPEMVILTKSDSRDSVEGQHVSDDFAKAGIDTRVVSVLDDAQLKALGDSVVEKLRVL